MKKDKHQAPQRPSLSGLFDKVLSVLDEEITRLPDTLQEAPPDKRLDFLTKNLPLLLRYRESGQGDPGYNWVPKWGDGEGD